MPSLVTDHPHVTAHTDEVAGPSIQRSQITTITMSMHESKKSDEVRRTAIPLSELSPLPKQGAPTEAKKKKDAEARRANEHSTNGRN
ncbi:hypothetical protein MML48_1g16449 [Holotrichia oblita]|uniref:Uncharacterized protein n=1 Tax=Holotrichia oblita TaxID=644536 RepID=A0ACB9TZE6_HOLOL|nr:hypothetical protein MML48_1g16449 [Holotrichia oblita]